MFFFMKKRGKGQISFKAFNLHSEIEIVGWEETARSHVNSRQNGKKGKPKKKHISI